MVYFGPSNACLTCKRRKKKCDETRPSCMRCLNANRTCGGYEDGQDLLIQQYSPKDGTTITIPSMAKKCSLPPRAFIPGTNQLEPNVLPREIPDEYSENRSIQAFIHDFCVMPLNPQASRGYISGLESMLLQLGLDSDIANACRAVAFANCGITLHRQILTRKAEVLYDGLLGTLAKAVVDPVLANTHKSLTVAMLLGLYEMIVARQETPSRHRAHARGVAAILQVNPDCSLQLLRLVRHGQPLISNGSIQDLFSLPSSKSIENSLDNLLLRTGLLNEKIDSMGGDPAIAADEVYLLQEAAIALDQDIAAWQSTRAKDCMPLTLGELRQKVGSRTYDVGYWPGRVDTYHDLYVSSVWNITRIARLLLCDLSVRLSSKTPNTELDNSLRHKEAQRLVMETLASIPYHLSANLQTFLQDAGKGTTKISKPGKPVGGLLLMHSLHVASQLEIVPPSVREYMRDCLHWIGANMGIGQASVMARAAATGARTQHFASDTMIVWTGFLV